MSLTVEEEKIMNKLNKEMKRNDLEIVSVKEWGSPRSNLQLFKPQEYCEGGCYVEIINNPGWATNYKNRWLDLNGDGNYDTGEMFKVATGLSYSGTSDAEYSSVRSYLRYNSTTGEVTTLPSANTAYDNTGTHNFHSSVTFRNIKVVSNKLYYLPTGTNAS